MRYVTTVLVIGILGAWMMGGSAAIAGDERAPAALEVPKGPAMTAVATRTSGRAGDVFPVDVYVSNIAALNAYQIKLKATGGAQGSLTLTDIAIDTSRKNYVFGLDRIEKIVDRNGGRAAAVKSDTNGVAVGKPVYAATLSFKASDDAKGTFTIAIEKGPAASMLTNSSAQEISFEPGKAATITIGTPKREKRGR